MKATLAVVALNLSAVFVSAASYGLFDSSTCVDKSGFEQCYDSLDDSWASCVSNYCGNPTCVASCKGDTACVRKNCPSLGIDCINACDCIRNTERVACAAGSCWNKAYSCEYEEAVLDVLNTCIDVAEEAIPYFLTPDSAPGSCSCDQLELFSTLEKIAEQVTACSNNQTNLDTLTSAAGVSDYGLECLCCQHTYTVSSFWKVCPNTQPMLLGADEYASIFQKHYEECSEILPNIDCERDFGFGAAVGDAMSGYYAFNSLPANGTETLYNKGGALATPTQATIVWTTISGQPPITIVAAQATKEPGKTSSSAAASKTGSAVSSGGRDAASASASGSDSGSGSAVASASASPTSDAAHRAHEPWILMSVCIVAMVVFV